MKFSLPCMRRIKTVENIISGGSRGVAPAPPPTYFLTKLRPEGQKKNFTTAPSPLSQDLDDHPPPPCPLIWRYGPATDNLQQLKLSVVWL